MEARSMSRFLRKDDIKELAEVLLGTDDSIEIGLSQIGIDPDEFDNDDIDFIDDSLNDTGLKYNVDQNEWLPITL